MKDLIRLSIRQKRTALWAYSLSGVGILLMYVAIFPSMQSQIDSYSQLVKSFPPALMKAFGADTSLVNFEGLLGTKQFGFMWPLLCIFLVVSCIGSELAGEIEKRTIGMWLSLPVSRMKVYWAKYTGALIVLAVFTLLSILTTVPIAAIFHVAITNSHIYSLTFVGFMFGFAVLGLAACASAFFSEKTKVYASIGSLLFVMYVLNLLSGLVSGLTNLKYASFFYYYNASDLLAGRHISAVSTLVFVAVGAGFAALGAAIFARRDISI